MQRCLQLAKLGEGNVAPNPMVGAILVYNDKIIGEGNHQKYGSAHAEINCINSVSENQKHLIAKSTLFVSLEPCSHFGKTPPCVEAIIAHKIPNVVIACLDIFNKVNGQGIEKLKAAGVVVNIGVLEHEAIDLNKRFFIFHHQNRPYIILKWAQTANKIIAQQGNERIFISNEITNRLTHKWRSQEAATLVGFNTALHDNPTLTTRNYSGKNPIRLVIDKNLTLPNNLHLLNKNVKTIIFNDLKESNKNENLILKKLNFKENIIPQILNILFQLNIQSVIIEGGAKTIQSFIDSNLWDEARVITNTKMVIENGLLAPQLHHSHIINSENLLNDHIQYFKNKMTFK